MDCYKFIAQFLCSRDYHHTPTQFHHNTRLVLYESMEDGTLFDPSDAPFSQFHFTLNVYIL